MAANDSLGDLTVSVTGDFSELESAIQGAVGKAEDGAQAIQGALNIPTAGDAVAQAFTEVGTAAAGASGQLELFGEASKGVASQMELFDGFTPSLSEHIEQVGQAAQGAGSLIEQFGDKAETAGEHAGHASESIGGIVVEGLKLFGIVASIEAVAEGIKEIAAESIEAFAEVQKAGIALTALTGSAEGAKETIEGLKGLAVSDALAFPSLLQATQRMTAFGIAAADIPRALQAAADASAATGNNFDAVAGAIERMSLSGTAGARQLVQLGLTAQNLASVMGVSATQMKESFKDMDPSERVAVIIDALDKYKGTAELMADSISGQWQNLKNAAHFTFEDIGDVAANGASGFTKAATVVIQALDDQIKKYAELQKAKNTRLEASAQETAAMLGEVSANSDFTAAIKSQTDAAQKQNDITKQLGVTLGGASEALGTMEAQQKKADQAVKDTAAAILEEQNNIKAGTGSLEVLNRAVVDHANAVERASPHTKDWADSIAGVTKNMADATTKAQSSIAVFQQVNDKFEAGTRSLSDLADAYSKAETNAKKAGIAFADAAGEAAKIAQGNAQTLASYTALQTVVKQYEDQLKDGNLTADQQAQAARNISTVYKELQSDAQKLGTTFYDATAEMIGLTDAANKQHVALEDSVKTFTDLAGLGAKTIDQQNALATAFKTVESEASKYGLSVQKIGDQLVFMVKPGQDATKAQQDLAVALNAAAVASGNFVTINGKLVPTLEAMATAAKDAGTGIGKIVQTADGGTVIISGLGDAAKKTAGHVSEFGAAAQQAGTYVVPLNSAVNDGKAYFVNAAGAADTHAKALKGVGDAAQGALTHIIPMNSAVNDGKAFYESAATAQQMLIRTHADLSDAAVAVRKAMYDEDQALEQQVHTTKEGTDATEKWSIAARDADGTIKQLDVSVQGADHDVEDFGTALTNATGDMGDATSAADGLAGGYDAVAAAAYDAATAVNTLGAAAAASEGAGGGFGGKNMSPTNAEGYLALMASMGADNAELDSAAQEFGLVPVGNRQYVTQDEFIKMTGGVLHVDGAGHLVGNAKADNTDQFGRPLASSAPTPGGPSSSSASSSSGIIALDQAAGSAASSVSNLGTAASSSASATSAGVPVVQAYSQALSDAAVPLGAFVTSVTEASKTQVNISSQVKSSADDAYNAMVNLGTGLQALDPSISIMKAGVDQFGAQLYSLTSIVNGQIETSTGTAEELNTLGAAAADASKGIQGLGSALGSTDVKVSVTNPTTYYGIDSRGDRIDFGAGDAGKAAFDAWNAAMQQGTAGMGQGSGFDPTASTDTKSSTTNPTSYFGYDGAGNKIDFGTGDAGKARYDAWNASLTAGPGGMAAAGLGSKAFDPMQNIDAFDPARGTGGMGSLVTNTGAGGTTIQVIVQGGTYIGANAGKQLADLAMPEVVAGLRRSGAKI